MTNTARRLRRIFAHATPLERMKGATWYPDARRETRRVARSLAISTRCFAGMVSALSPRVRWELNIRYAEQLCNGWGEVPPVMSRGLLYATRIYVGEPPLKVLSGPKTRAFYRALCGDDNAVVLDVWMWRALLGEVPNWGALYARRYKEYEEVVRLAALDVGVAPCTFQATIWVAERGRDVPRKRNH